MKIELKNIKHAAFASEETHCFSATVWIDGKRAGEVSNDGHGGSNRWHPWELEAQIDTYAATLPPLDVSDLYADGQPHTMEQSAETLIGELVNEWLTTRDLKRKCARQVLFRKPGETYRDGEYHILKTKWSPAAKDFINQKYPGATILNETLGA